jgi:hypothetical protein
MGTDIHSLAEVRGDDGIWRAVGRVFPYPYHRADRPTTWHWYDDSQPEGARTYIANERFNNQPVYQRNYRLFACLAGVRNGRGFAGVTTGNAVEPIAEPRGVPDDASPEWLGVVDHWGADLHSMSWLTIEEIAAYDWNQEVLNVGYMTEKEYLALKETGEPPSSYSGGVWGRSILALTAAEYGEATPAELDFIRAGKEIYVQGFWPKMLRSEIGESFFEVLDVLKGLHPDPRPGRLRVRQLRRGDDSRSRLRGVHRPE